MLERLFPQQADDKLFVEDVFSTYLYTGNGSTQTITNGIDLADKGGLVWLKARSSAENNFLFDTNRGVQKRLVSNSTADQFELSDGLSAFNSNGFTLGSGYTANGSGLTLASWTFRKAPKFFDVVTYTGNGVSGRAISHNLGVAPGVIIVKRTNGATDWPVYHRSLGDNKAMILNRADSVYTWNVLSTSTPTATQFFVNAQDEVNTNGGTYVAYLFAHDPSADGIIQCGSYDSATTINLGWEPQWLMVKRSTSSGNWYIINNMTGFNSEVFGPRLFPNSSAAEGSDSVASVTATGFNSRLVDGAGTYIYVAIRRGPMRTPTLGTSVFAPVTRSGASANTTVTASFPIDLSIIKNRTAAALPETYNWTDRLRGVSAGWISSASLGGEQSNTGNILGLDSNTAVRIGSNYRVNGIGDTYVDYFFRRAPGFMDVVCYTGTGVNRTVNHNLGVVPEMMIIKLRSGISPNGWAVYHAALGPTMGINLNLAGAAFSIPTGYWNGTAPTSSLFSLGNNGDLNSSGSTYVAYLFASVPGVSKVGSYTGNGSSQTINCAFTTGARFVLIKRTNAAGDWYVWDSARGIVAGNDPYLALNTTAAEVTTNDSVDPDSTGFIVNQDGTTNINVNGATYIFLSIA